MPDAILAEYEQRGDAALAGINGYFHGVLVDIHRRTVTVFNDRYGLGRLYVAERQNGDVLFAHEAKSLLAVLKGASELDLGALAEFVTCGCVLQNKSLFSNISVLPPASKWTWSPDGGLRKDKYFDFACWEAEPKLGCDAFATELQQLFPAAVQSCLSGLNGTRAAMSLTGGVDGRMIMACAREPAGSLPCYTFGSPLRETIDVKLARRIAKVCAQPHQVIPIDSDFFRDFMSLAAKSVYISDGNMDVTGAAELYVNRVARQIGPVRITGNYGSEVLRGNVAFKPRIRRADLFDPEFLKLCHAAAARYEEERKTDLVPFIVKKQLPWHHYARLSVEESQLRVISPFIDNNVVRLAMRAGDSEALGKKPSFKVIASGNPALTGIPTDRGLKFSADEDAKGGLAAWVQTFTFKAEYAYDYGMPGWLLRIDNAFSPLQLEKLFLGRHKFCHFRTWYRKQLGPVLQQALSDPTVTALPVYRKGAVANLACEHVAGRANNTDDISTALTLSLLQGTLCSPNN